MPSKETIIRQLKRTIKNYSGGENVIRSVFVASDSNHMLNELRDALKRMKIQVFKYGEKDPHVDLAILGMANHFIGNCISSYSSFVKRERDEKGFPSSFWAFPAEKQSNGIKNIAHDEF